MGKFEQIIEARQKLYSLSEEVVPPGQQQRRPPVWNTAPNQQAGQQPGATGAQQGSAQVGQVGTVATTPVPPPPPGDAQGVSAAAPAASSPAPATPPADGTAPVAAQTSTVASNAETELQSKLGMSPEQAKKAAQIVNSIQNGQV